jgi:hypothetical protein
MSFFTAALITFWLTQFTFAKYFDSIDEMFSLASEMLVRNLKRIKINSVSNKAILSAVGQGGLSPNTKITISLEKEDGMWKISSTYME